MRTQSADCVEYEYMGAHRAECGGHTFRVFAPDAEQVFLVGDFCSWDEGISMRRLPCFEVWEITVPDGIVHEGEKYKFKIFERNETCYVADPYAFASEGQHGNASAVCELGDYVWRDSGWLCYRQRKVSEHASQPINIYEIDLGSWKHRPNGEFCAYGEIARELAPYVKQMGYTHIALTPVMEYERDEGDIFDVRAYFAPTARFGAPRDFKAFVDNMHEAGIGVILELELSKSALARLDPFVKDIESFFKSCVCFWVEEYHVDGICLNGVADLAEHAFGGGRHEAIDFMGMVNSYLKNKFPDVLTLSLDVLDAQERKKLAADMLPDTRWGEFMLDRVCKGTRTEDIIGVESMGIATEASLVAISHKDVRGEGRSFLDRMEGEHFQKFARVRALMGYVMTCPGKKLTFMGVEIGQSCGWKRTSSMEWSVLGSDAHSRLQLYTARLGSLYLSTECLYRGSFELIDTGIQGLICYRRAVENKEVIVFVNLTQTEYKNFRFETKCKVIFNSDEECFGGEGIFDPKEDINDAEDEADIRIPPLSVIIFDRV